MIKNMKSVKALGTVSPMDMKQDVAHSEISMNYNWSEQRSADVMKFGTSGTTQSQTPGNILRDVDSWMD